VANAVVATDERPDGTRAARRILYVILLHIGFFVLFNIGSSGSDAFQRLYLKGDANETGVYFFLVITVSAMFLLTVVWRRMFYFDAKSVAILFFDIAAIFGALFGLLVAATATSISPFFHNAAIGFALSLLVVAPDLLCLDSAGSDRRRNR
jgi:hypothetical protein